MPRSILDPTFRYVPAAETDLRRTFARIRREQKAIAEEKQAKVKQLASGFQCLHIKHTKTPT